MAKRRRRLVGVYRKEHEICATFCAIFIHRLLGIFPLVFADCTIAVNTPHCNAVSLFSNFTFFSFAFGAFKRFHIFVVIFHYFFFSVRFFCFYRPWACDSFGWMPVLFLNFYLVIFLSKNSLRKEEKLFYWFLGKFPSPISLWFRWLPLSVIFSALLIVFRFIRFKLLRRAFRNEMYYWKWCKNYVS